MFKKILFATSATEICDHAARVAFNLAKQYSAELTVFHVLGVPSRGYSQTVVDVRTGEKIEADEDYQAWVLEELKVHYAKQLAEKPDTLLDVVVGWPYREILRKAREIEPDLIVMGNSAGSEDSAVLQNLVAGTTLHRVIKAAACPVMVVARTAASFWGGISNVVFSTDFSKVSDAGFDFAYSVAKAVDGELHLFHPVDISTAHMGTPLAQDVIEKHIREARQRMHGRYVSKIEDFKNYSVEAWEGSPYVEVVKYAREQQADLLVLAHETTPSSSDEERLRSDIEQVMVRANCPVVVLKRAPIKKS